ncbi:MAG: tetratricopeptide repeat protein [Chitinophagia bacterium]|nr:tetratricopeptide repeat protein [Chitinophagia bacterium]
MKAKNILLLISVVLLTSVGIVGCGNNTPKNGAANDNTLLTTDASIKVFTDAITKDPKNASLYYQRGIALRKMKEDTFALADFKKAAALDSTKAMYYSAAGDVLFEHKDVNGAIEWLRKAIALDPGDVLAHIKIAKLFLYLQQYAESFKELNYVLRKDPYNPEIYFLKGMVYKDMKDTANAISNFQTTLEVAPDYKEAAIQLGLLYTAQKNQLGLKYLDKAFKLDTMDVLPIFAQGEYYLNNKDTARAIQEFRKCIVRDVHYIDAYFNLGSIYIQKDSFEKAFHQFDLVTKMDPTNPTGYFNRGLCSELLGKVNDAILDYRKALVIDSAYDSPKKALQRLNAAAKH